MSRYIKVDDYKDIESDYLIHGEYGQETRYMQMMDDVIANKSIDIVFCKECKHREKYPCDEIEFYECSHLRLYGTKVGVEDDWFCADGERRAEQTERSE